MAYRNLHYCVENFGSLLRRPFLLLNRLFLQEDESKEDASIILLFEDVYYKVKSTSKLLRVSRDLLYVLF